MDTPLQRTRREKVLFILVIQAIIIGLVFVFLQFSTSNSLKASIEDEKVALAQAEALLQQRLDYQANAPIYREKAARYMQMMPKQPQEEEILRIIMLIGEEYDLRVQEVRFDARVARPESGFVQMPMLIIVEGSYSGLIQMLDQLQWGGRAFRVDQVKISLSGAAPSGIRATLTASVFYRTVN